MRIIAFVASAGVLAVVALIANCASLGDLSGGGNDSGAAVREASAGMDTGIGDTGAHADQGAQADAGDADADADADAAESAAPDAAEAGCGTWCSCQTPPHKLCNDFDNGMLFNDPNWPLTVGTMATVTLDDGGSGGMLDYVSPPYAAHFTVGSIPNGPMLPQDTVIPSVSHQVIGAVSTLTCAMDLLLLHGNASPSTYVEALLLSVNTTAVGREDTFYQIGLGGGSVYVYSQSSQQFGNPLPLQVGWTRYFFSYVPLQGASQFQAGSGDGDASVLWTAPPFVNSGFSIQVGMPGSNIGTGGWDVLIDNVTCDW